MRVAITGATGLIGTALRASLAADGHEVRILTRSPRAAGEFRFDPAAGVLDPAALESADAVVHLAGEPIAQRWTDTVRRRIRDSRVNGTRLVAAAIAAMARPPRVLVSGSAVGYYGERGDETLLESSLPGNDFLSEVCVAWEAAAAPAREAGIRVVHPRIGVVLSEKGGALQRLLLPFRLGVGGRVGSGDQWMSWISLADTVGALRHTIDDADVEGPVNITGPAPATNAEFTRTLAAVLHRPAFLPVPAFALRIAFNEMADATLMASQRAMPGRLTDAGFAFRHRSLDGALRAVL